MFTETRLECHQGHYTYSDIHTLYHHSLIKFNYLPSAKTLFIPHFFEVTQPCGDFDFVLTQLFPHFGLHSWNCFDIFVDA